MALVSNLFREPDKVLMFFYPDYNEVRELKELKKQLEEKLNSCAEAYKQHVAGYWKKRGNFKSSYISPEEFIRRNLASLQRYTQLYNLIQKSRPRKLKKYGITLFREGYKTYEVSSIKLSDMECKDNTINLEHTQVLERFNIRSPRYLDYYIKDYLIVEGLGEVLLTYKSDNLGYSISSYNPLLVLFGKKSRVSLKGRPRKKETALWIKPDIGSSKNIRKIRLPPKRFMSIYTAAKFLHYNGIIDELTLNKIFAQKTITYVEDKRGSWI